MRVATIASLGASALLGVGALFVAKVWLPNANSGPSKAEASPTANMTTIVAAGAAVPFGTKLEAKNLTLIKVPAASVPQGAYTSIEQVVAQDGGAPVTLTALSPREPILPTRLSGPGVKPSVAATIAPGLRAYTIKVNDVAGGGGHVLPGDHVDVILARALATSGVEGSEGNRTFVSTLVLQNVRVLGMDMIADPASVEKFAPSTATLEVSVMDAGKLAVAGQAGTLSLVLRRSGSTDVAEFSPITAREVTGSTGGVAAPRPAAGGGIVARRKAAPRGPGIRPAAPAARGLIVTQGGQKTVVTVPTERLGS
jgi:pilus assembly protein CpaB